MTQELDVALAVTQVLDALPVLYCIGGSFASTVHGEERATRDVDLLVALRTPHVRAFVQALTTTFFIQEQDVQDAVVIAPTLQATPWQRATFSMIHQATFFKADIFVSSGRAFDTSQFARRVAITVAPDRTLAVASAEDTILAKLEWYRMGNEVSDRQWRDVLSVLAAQATMLDESYVRQWADALGVRDLLERALGNAAQSPPDRQQRKLFDES